MDSINLGTYTVPTELTALVGVLGALNYRVVLMSTSGVVSAVAIPSTAETEQALSAQTPPSQLGLAVQAVQAVAP